MPKPLQTTQSRPKEMITNIRLFHAKKMRTSRVPAPMTWLVFTLLLSLDAAAAGTVKVTTTPVFLQIPRYQASKDFQVLVRVEAPPAVEKQRRVPVDLAVVIDVGGSGGTARLDAVKKAVKFIVSQIHDDDRLAIVGPSNYRLVTGFLNTGDARRNAHKSVDDLEPRRGEFTSGAGLEEAIKILGDLPATASRARSVILVTDTAVAEGSSRFSKLPVHTIGLGAAADPRVLLSIARQSQGTYSFVDDQNTDGITGAIAIRLSELKNVVAVDTRVLVDAPVGVTIERIESGGYRTSLNTRDDGKSASGEVAVGALYAGEVKSFLVHLSVPALPSTTTSTVDGGCDKQQLLTASFFGGYTTSDAEDSTAPASPSPATTVTKTQAILYVQRPPPEALDVTGVGTLQRVPVPVVMNHIARFGVLEMVTTFVDNDIRKLSSSITEEVAMKLRKQWEQFVQARQFWSGLDLGVLDVEVNRMVSILEAAAAGTRSGSSTTLLSSATAYMLSWLSSYQMQRPTAMGSPVSVAAAFVTVNMQLTLQQATTITTAPLCIGGGDDGGCPVCEDHCVRGPPVLEPSGRDDGTYRVNAAYLPVPGVLVDAINEAMKQMYLALIQANKLRRCDAAAGVEVLQPPPPRAVAFA